METPFSKEYISSLLADITSKLGFGWVQSIFRPVVDKTVAVVEEKKKETEKLRRDYAGCIAEMDEPFRSLLNNQYRLVRKGKFGVDEETFIELMMKKLDMEGSREEREKYLKYFAKLQKFPRPDPYDPGVIYLSIEEELDKFYDGSLRKERKETIRARWELRKATRALRKRRTEKGELKWNFFYGFYR